LSGYTVSYLAVEAGQYTQAAHGISFEAVKTLSTITDDNNSWLGQAQSYENAYTNPVVIGQVMTENDPAWSVFWASNGNRINPPDSSGPYVGKHVAEDPETMRADETIGYLVFEAGITIAGPFSIEAGVTPDTVEGVTEVAAPWSYPVESSGGSPVVSAAAMDGSNGGWPVLYGVDALGGGTLSVAIDEDQLADTERIRTTDQVAYVIVDDFEPQTEPEILFPSNYELGILAVDELVYVDRSYTYTGMPTELQGLPVVRTANDDKRADVDLRIQLSAPRTLYVGFDVRGSELPAWLQSWELVPGWLITTIDTDLRIYRQDFPAGEVALGGTGFPSGSFSMYVVVID